MAAIAMALRVMFRLRKSTADTADRQPNTAAGDQSCIRIILNMTQAGILSGVDRRKIRGLATRQQAPQPSCATQASSAALQVQQSPSQYPSRWT